MAREMRNTLLIQEGTGLDRELKNSLTPASGSGYVGVHMTTIRHNGNLLALLCLSGVGLLAPGLAHAQDADGDGVPDVRDVCPTTPPATTVDGAGCDAFCEVVDSTSDVFLRSRLLEVGTHAAGSFGSSIAPPASWHARVTGASTDRLGFVANPQADGWTNYNGDFFVPGTPEEGFGLSIGGRNYYNGGLVGSNGIAGGFTGTRVECLPLVCGRRGGGSVFWSGAVAGINVDHTYSVLNEGLFILVEVTLTNTTGAAQTVTYLRNVDPDNQRPLTGVYATRNTIISQGDGTAASQALVSAETDAVPGVADASYIALLSSDPDARVTYGGFSNRNPNDVFDCTGGLTCATGSSTTRDIAISLAVRKTIPAGRSVTFSYAYTLDVVSVATSAACTVPAICGDGVVEGTESCDDGGTAAGDGCDPTCNFEPGYVCTGSPSVCVPDCGDGMIVGAETCDDGGTAAGDGCSATCTIESGYGCMGAPSTCAPVCGDGMIIGAETCDDGGTTAGDGCSDACALETGFVCVGTPSVCGICVDTEAGATADLGCMAGAPICVGSGVTAFCAPCVDDTSGGMDTGCAATAPSCDTSGAPAHLCQACEDTAADAGVDNGCVAATPVCGTGSAGAPTCFECVTDAHCSTGTVCNAAGACVPGCADDSDCVPSPATPLCDITARSCVECLADTDCTGTEICSASSACTSIDTDGDGVPDADDLDDDNDGIPDTSEVDPSLVGDSDDDGVLDYEDPDFVTCTDADANGVCDELPESVDFDQDGIANHLDLDADGDGVNDLVEGGGEDTNGDGLVDDFVDGNGDGLNDAYAASPLPLPNTDGTDGPDFLDVDDDGDGVNTIFEGPTAQDTDGDGTPDYLDADDDGDGMPTVDENADPNGDGDPADALDTDGDGTPDYLDPADNSDAGMSDGGMADGGDAGTLDGSVPSGGGVSGGALCSASPGPGRSAPIWLIFSALLSILVVRRRRS